MGRSYMCCNLLSLTDNEIEQCTEKSRKLIEALKGPSDLDKKIDSLIKSDLNKSQIKKYIKEDVISAHPTATKREIRWQINRIARIILLRRKYQKYDTSLQRKLYKCFL